MKPAKPLTETRDGKARVRKYEAPKGQRPHAFFPPGTRVEIADPNALLLLTEGEKKALSAADVYGYTCVGLSGVDCWRAKGGRGKLLPELEAIDWKDRPVAVVFDADAVTNPRVQAAEQELAVALARSGAVVSVVRLPGPEKGLDDFLVARGPNALSALIDAATECEPNAQKEATGHNLTDLTKHASPTPPDQIPPWAPGLPEDPHERAAFCRAMAGQDDAREAEKKVPPLTTLVRQAQRRFELFRSADGVAYASEKKMPAVPVESTVFRDRLYLLHENTVGGGRDVATPNMISSAVGVLAAHARFAEVRPLLLRSGRCGDAVYGHRADPEAMGEVVVDSSGWRTVSAPLGPEPEEANAAPVRFAFGPSAGTLPTPADAGDINELREFINLDDPDQFPLVAAWVGAAVLSGWPVPILMLCGQRGTAKSTAARVLMRLIDPAAGDDPLRGRPKDEETLALAARNAHLLVFDNLSGMDNDLADLLCRVATGGAFAARKKYTDADESRITLRRPVILTGIDLPSLRGDLLERMLTVRLRPIPDGERVTEDEFFARFDAARPRILAGLYALISRGMDAATDLTGMTLPRMADFAKFAARTVGRAVVEGRLAADARDIAAASLDGYRGCPRCATSCVTARSPGRARPPSCSPKWKSDSAATLTAGPNCPDGGRAARTC